MRRWTRPLPAEPDRAILSHVWTTSTCYKPLEIERRLQPQLGWLALLNLITGIIRINHTSILDHSKRELGTVLCGDKLRDIERKHAGLIHPWDSRAVFKALGNSPSRSIALSLLSSRALSNDFFSHLLLRAYVWR